MTKLKKLKCPNWIKPRFTPGGLRKADKRKGTLRFDYADIRDEPVPEGFERCNGDLTVEVSASDAPMWGGSYAELEVTVNCNICGTSYIEPCRMTDEDWVTELVAEALDAKAKEYRR